VTDELEGGESAPKTLAKSITSFKTLTECPIIVVLLLQVHRNVIATNMPRLVPLIMDVYYLVDVTESRCLPYKLAPKRMGTWRQQHAERFSQALPQVSETKLSLESL
jgi:hypothetical protein